MVPLSVMLHFHHCSFFPPTVLFFFLTHDVTSACVRIFSDSLLIFMAISCLYIIHPVSICADENANFHYRPQMKGLRLEPKSLKKHFFVDTCLSCSATFVQFLILFLLSFFVTHGRCKWRMYVTASFFLQVFFHPPLCSICHKHVAKGGECLCSYIVNMYSTLSLASTFHVLLRNRLIVHGTL